MKKLTLENLQNSGVRSVISLGTKAHQRKFITLGEVAYEASLLLSRSAPSIIEEIPVFTDWVDACLSAPFKRQKRNSWKWSRSGFLRQVNEER